MNRNGLLATMDRSFGLFRVRGLDVRAHWTMLFYFIVAFQVGRERYHGWELVTAATLGVAVLYAVALLCELSQAFAARRVGIPVAEIRLAPLGGLFARDRDRLPPRAELYVVLCGLLVYPLIIVVAAVPCYALTYSSWDPGFAASLTIQLFFWVSVGLMGIHLLPALPLAGGRLTRALLALRIGTWTATQVAAVIGQAVSAIAIVPALLFAPHGALLAMVCVRNILVCMQLRLVARAVDSFQRRSRGIELLYASSAVVSEDDETGRAPVSYYAADDDEALPAEDEGPLAAEPVHKLKAQVDVLLEKISRTGQASLSRREQRFLIKASRYYKK
ncbi:MAG: hypothetical protein ACKVX7_19280 [Planctomycetota bacterium]